MSDYQRIKQTKYILGRILYNKTIWRIRDYYRLKDMADYLLEQSNNQSDLPSKTNLISDSVGNIAAKREIYLKEIKIIDECLKGIPEEYRKGVWGNIVHRQPYPRYADRSTYGRWKSKFIYDVANKLESIEI